MVLLAKASLPLVWLLDRSGRAAQFNPGQTGMETGQYQAALLLYGSTGLSHEEQ
jgi:hypothetical protein